MKPILGFEKEFRIKLAGVLFLFVLLLLVIRVPSLNHDNEINSIEELKQLPSDYQCIGIAWYKPGDIDWEVVKTWAGNSQEGKQIKDFVLNIQRPDHILHNPLNKMVLIFCDGKKVKTFEFTFEVRGNTFMSELGSDNRLPALLSPLPEMETMEIPVELNP